MELADVADSKSAGSDTVPVRLRPAAPRRSKGTLCSVFLMQEKHPLATFLLLFRKRSRSRRLLACKRTRNAYGSLPTFCEFAPVGAKFLSVRLFRSITPV